MGLQQATKDFLGFLRVHPELRAAIRAAPGKTLLYSGGFGATSAAGGITLRPAWKDIAELRRTRPEWADKELLNDVLIRIGAPGTAHPHLYAYAEDVERLVPDQPDGFIVWRALSGIFAANATGAVSFQIGTISLQTSVFAATELSVLLRNKNIDARTKDVLAYYQRCIQSKNADLNFGFASA